MVDLRAIILQAIVTEPGERTPAQLASDLGLRTGKVRRVVRSLRRSGLVAPAAYRVCPHRSGHGLTRCGLAESETARRVRGVLVETDADGNERARPMLRSQIEGALGVAEGCGNIKRALRELHGFGVVSIPGEAWPTEAGIAWVNRGAVGPADMGGSDVAA